MKIPPMISKVLLLLVILPTLVLVPTLTAQDINKPIPLSPNDRAPLQIPSFAPDTTRPEMLEIGYLTSLPRHSTITILLMGGAQRTGKLLTVKSENGVVCLELTDGRRGWYKSAAIEGVEAK